MKNIEIMKQYTINCSQRETCIKIIQYWIQLVEVQPNAHFESFRPILIIAVLWRYNGLTFTRQVSWMIETPKRRHIIQINGLILQAKRRLNGWVFRWTFQMTGAFMFFKLLELQQSIDYERWERNADTQNLHPNHIDQCEAVVYIGLPCLI